MECGGMDAREREQLAAAIVEALEERATVDGTRLLELVRAEQNLSDALAVIRREIDFIIRSTQRPSEVP